MQHPQETLVNKPFDIVVHGATGFTGRLVVEYPAALPPGQRFALAMGGRSADKLAAIVRRARCPVSTPLVVTTAATPPA